MNLTFKIIDSSSKTQKHGNCILKLSDLWSLKTIFLSKCAKPMYKNFGISFNISVREK